MIEEILGLISENPMISEEVKAAFISDFEKYLESENSPKTVDFEISPLGRNEEKEFLETFPTPNSEGTHSFEMGFQRKGELNESLGNFRKSLLNRIQLMNMNQNENESELISLLYSSVGRPSNSASFSVDGVTGTGQFKKRTREHQESFSIDLVRPKLNEIFEVIQHPRPNRDAKGKNDKEIQCDLAKDKRTEQMDFSKEEINVLLAIRVLPPLIHLVHRLSHLWNQIEAQKQ